MSEPRTMQLPATPTTIAPDGSDVRVLLAVGGGSMAHFSLPPGRTSACVRHRTVEEIWYLVAGHGQMWRELAGWSSLVDLEPGTCVTIPLGTRFQFRNVGDVPLEAVGVTMPPWPGDDEAVAVPGYPDWA